MKIDSNLIHILRLISSPTFLDNCQYKDECIIVNDNFQRHGLDLERLSSGNYSSSSNVTMTAFNASNDDTAVNMAAFNASSYESSVSMTAFNAPDYYTAASMAAFNAPSYESAVSMAAFNAPSYESAVSMAAFNAPSYESAVSITAIFSKTKTRLFWCRLLDTKVILNFKNKK